MAIRKIIIVVTLLLSLPVLASPMPFPVFLKPGFSSVLEFDEVPIRVVLGDSQSFQVEKLDHSIVIRTLVSDAASNMFVYFKDAEPRLFVLRASEDAEPTYYKKMSKTEISTPLLPTPLLSQKGGVARSLPLKRATRLLGSRFDPHKDYLSLLIQISADSTSEVKPVWNEIRLKYQDQILKPYKLWAERKEVQRDSQVKARIIFVKPSVPENLQGVALFIPLHDSKEPVLLSLRGGK